MNNPQLDQILAILDKFGFKFFGYNESKEPLVIAPNGQVITVAVAYKFVQDQILRASGGSSKGPEGLSQMPKTSFDAFKTPDIGIEKSIEKGIESQKNNADTSNESNKQQSVTTPQTANPAATQPVKVESPYGDGFQIKDFNPYEVDKTIAFIKSNSNASNTTTKGWLKAQFEKFILEIQNGKQ